MRARQTGGVALCAFGRRCPHISSRCDGRWRVQRDDRGLHASSRLTQAATAALGRFRSMASRPQWADHAATAAVCGAASAIGTNRCRKEGEGSLERGGASQRGIASHFPQRDGGVWGVLWNGRWRCVRADLPPVPSRRAPGRDLASHTEIAGPPVQGDRLCSRRAACCSSPARHD
jgi:hypothetical protein